MHLRILLAVLAIASLGYAHFQPTTLVILDVELNQVSMRLHIPLPELELAFGHGVTQDPERTRANWGPALREYVTQHVHAVTPEGQPWSASVKNMTLGKSTQTQSGPFQEVTLDLVLTPPTQANVRHFILKYDVIMHQVVTHKALVSVHSDWAGGKVESLPAGVIAVNTTTTRIDPFVIDLGEGNSWIGFGRMVRLGMQHIREGLDHLLFILVLLLPATLNLRGREWGSFAGTERSLMRLIKIVSAFTLGHSFTLLAGALHWVTLPQQPVEVLIAFSIFVTAIHAIHPIFPDREARVAGGFGLVHGLAFATVLSDLNLSAGPMALSILGFNLGIELMQLFVIALTVPWLILLSQTAAHRWVRRGGALLAGIAAIAWIVNRVSGAWNLVERWTEAATKLAPLGILALAFIALDAYGYCALGTAAAYLRQKENQS